ncbi:MAG: endonuclease domain-containing protein [bacterium]
MQRLKVKEVSECRATILESQRMLCGLCQLPCSTTQAVLDHDHLTGAVRGVLHRSCNALLGKVENNYRRYGLQNLAAFCNGLAPYLQKHAVNRTGLLHPTFKTEDEKRERRNALARKRRATASRP